MDYSEVAWRIVFDCLSDDALDALKVYEEHEWQSLRLLVYYYMPCVYIRYWNSKSFLSTLERSALGMRHTERIRYNNELDYRVIDADPVIQKVREELWLTLSDNRNVKIAKSVAYIREILER